MASQEVDYDQLTIFDLLPGSAGGRALRDLRGSAYFAELARRAAAKRTPEERQEASRRATQERRRRLYTIPHTESFVMAGCRITQRVVPWWPHQKERLRNRKKPVLVRIDVGFVDLKEEDAKRS